MRPRRAQGIKKRNCSFRKLSDKEKERTNTVYM